jgi:hypothetical protein
MSSRPYYSVPAILAALAFAYLGAHPGAVSAVQTRTIQDDEWCRDDYGGHDGERYCEVRETTLPADRELIAIDARPNGGIRVEGWDKNEILVRAKVLTRADSEADARAIAEEIEVRTSGGTIRTEGPSTGRHESWSVSYRVYVPRRSNLNLKSSNGGIAIEAVSGAIRFRTTNGGIRLTGLAGDVSGSTTNGGVRIELTGDRWDGEGLDVRTTNGGLKIAIPEGYNARLESGTVNGGFSVEFPITLQGRIDRRIESVLGDGGKTIRAFTTNGRVVVRRA